VPENHEIVMKFWFGHPGDRKSN